MPRQEPEQDMSIQDHLNGDRPIDATGYETTSLVLKSKKDEFLANGYTVIRESDNSDLILMGKAKQDAISQST